jgi:hypothetical protein
MPARPCTAAAPTRAAAPFRRSQGRAACRIYCPGVEWEEIRPGSVVLEDELDTEEWLWRDSGEDDHAGWWCVRTDPFPCPANGCSFVAEFMTAAHLVLVWQERDDPNLLWHAQRAKEVGRNPRVVSYASEFGPSASYYAWEAAGRPVHGVKGERPAST